MQQQKKDILRIIGNVKIKIDVANYRKGSMSTVTFDFYPQTVHLFNPLNLERLLAENHFLANVAMECRACNSYRLECNFAFTNFWEVSGEK